ncbi:MAG: dynamin family protein [Pseudomonadota bacterium]
MPNTDSKFSQYQEGFRELNAFWAKLDKLDADVEAFAETALSFVDEPLDRVREKIRAFEPSVSVIGQIKAGKSTLLNAIIGQPDLLPSDVNPWTSVITGLHLNNRFRPVNTRAVFRFFDRHEWDRLAATGGRLGEMAKRAGFDSEADAVRSQVDQMRQTTEERLGEEFEDLLGGSRTYPDLDKDVLDRYICYGDPDDIADGARDGIYADITKFADLYIDSDFLPKGLCLRDTPGVNDTFMMREQITLNAISDSRVCVVVLSAHQALSAMDLAILRIICSVDAREVLIFVNRIDQLAQPQVEVENIRKSVEKTLRRIGVGDGIEILFGSGYWANCALGDPGSMRQPSRDALAEFFGGDTDDPELLRQRAMEASGVFQLLRAIANRVVEGPGAAILNDLQKDLDTIIEMSETVESVAEQRMSAPPASEMTQMMLSLKIADVHDRVLKSFDERVAGVRAHLVERLDRAQDTFVESATEALQSHINAFSEAGTWTHDPTSLRMMMRTAYVSACGRLRREGESAFDTVLDGVQEILETDLGVYREGSSIEFPEQQQHKAPTILARTIALDLQGRWWRKFWRFGREHAAQKRYRATIVAETTPIIDGLMDDFFEPAVRNTRDIVEKFLIDQGAFCKAILESYETDATGKSDPDSMTKRLIA